MNRWALFIPILLAMSCGGRPHYATKVAGVAIDPLRDCGGLAAGSLCGGGKFIGEVGGQKYVATPAGCTDSSTPICDDSIDIVTKPQEEFMNAPAWEYCLNLNYNGFTDWQLPGSAVSQEMYSQRSVIGGFESGLYWTSNQYYYDEWYAIDMTTGVENYYWQDQYYYIRCVRVSPN